MQVRKQQLELDMEQKTGSKQGKECVKAVYCHPAYLTYMQSTSWETLGWRKHKAGIKIAGRNINNLRYADNTTLMVESEEELKSLLMKVKEESQWKSWLKTQHSEYWDHGIWSHHFMANRRGNSRNSDRLYFFGGAPKSLQLLTYPEACCLSAYLRLLIFLPAILIPACALSSPAFLIMYSAYKLNKQGDNIQSWHTPFPIWNQSVVHVQF